MVRGRFMVSVRVSVRVRVRIMVSNVLGSG